MKHHDPEPPDFGARLVLLAGERTLLAWLRLAVAMMALGFVLDRFGIYLQVEQIASAPTWLHRAYTFWVGTALVVLGAVTSAAAGVIYSVYHRDCHRSGITGPRGSFSLGLLVAAATTLVGLVTAAFLLAI